MRIIYIAGKYRGKCEWDVRMNIRSAEQAAVMVWQYGGVAICPHKNTAGFGGVPGCDDNVWLQGDIEILLRCDAIWAIDGRKESSGARNEVNIARINSIPVLYSIQDVIDYLKRDNDPTRRP